MILYDVQCKCGNKKEVYLKLGQEPPLCPKCGQQMKKVISATTFILIGSGWARDSYGLHQIKGKQNAK